MHMTPGKSLSLQKTHTVRTAERAYWTECWCAVCPPGGSWKNATISVLPILPRFGAHGRVFSSAEWREKILLRIRSLVRHDQRKPLALRRHALLKDAMWQAVSRVIATERGSAAAMREDTGARIGLLTSLQRASLNNDVAQMLKAMS